MEKNYFLQPIVFPQKNTTYAENQPEYTPLPVHKSIDGCVTSCWQMPVWERIKFLFSGKIFVCSMTFNQPLQPLRLTTLFYNEGQE